MDIRPDVLRKPPDAAKQPGGAKTGDPKKPEEQPKKKINESTIITVAIIIIFLLVSGISYTFLGHSTGAANADGALSGGGGRDVMSSQGSGGGNGASGSALEGRTGAGRDGSGTLVDSVQGNQNAPNAGQRANIGDAMSAMGGARGANTSLSTGGNGQNQGAGALNDSTGVRSGTARDNNQYNLYGAQGAGRGNQNNNGGYQGAPLPPGLKGD